MASFPEQCVIVALKFSLTPAIREMISSFCKISIDFRCIPLRISTGNKGLHLKPFVVACYCRNRRLLLLFQHDAAWIRIPHLHIWWMLDQLYFPVIKSLTIQVLGYS